MSRDRESLIDIINAAKRILRLTSKVVIILGEVLKVGNSSI